MPSSDPCAAQEPVELFLKHLFRRALRYSVAASVLATGCASSTEDTEASNEAGSAGLSGSGTDSPTSAGGSAPGGSGTDPDAPDNTGAVGGTPSSGGPGSEETPVDPGTPEPSDPTSAPGETNGTPVACPDGVYLPIFTAGFDPAASPDYLSLRETYDHAGPGASDDWTLTNYTVLNETGEACASASSDACAEKVSKHPASMSNPQCGMICSELSVVTTAGDEVERWASPAELIELFGAINTADEALMMVHANGYSVACNSDNTTVLAVEGGAFEITATRVVADCAPFITNGYLLRVDSDGTVTELDSWEASRDENLCAGRRPEGLRNPSHSGPASNLGEYLARMAHLEGASIVAFERLARELSEFGAPPSLVAKALRSAREEARHTEVIGQLARARGATPAPVLTDAPRARSLEELAIENAVEGCVRETYGALVGAHQGLNAQDAMVRVAMRAVAADELRHSALSWEIHSWAMGKLSPGARERVRRAQLRALGELRVRAGETEDELVTRLAGLPGASQSERLLACVARELWEPALGVAQAS